MDEHIKPYFTNNGVVHSFPEGFNKCIKDHHYIEELDEIFRWFLETLKESYQNPHKDAVLNFQNHHTSLVDILTKAINEQHYPKNISVSTSVKNWGRFGEPKDILTIRIYRLAFY